MPYQNLRDFLAALERDGELARICQEIDPCLEITEVANRVMKSPDGGKALLFENPRNSKIPLLINALGSRKRIRMALGAENLQDIAQGYLAMLDPAGVSSFLDKLRMLPKLKALADAMPKEVSSGPCQEVVLDRPSFRPFPIMTCWPGDGGPYITLPMVFTRNPESGIRNCGMYRLQVFDETTCGLHWHIHKGGAEHYRRAARKGKRLDVSIAIGCDPATMFSAMAPLPPDVDEMMLAGLLRKKRVAMAKCLTNSLSVPAESEMVFEGYVDPEETRLEGPFGDHTGFYSLPDQYPVFHLTAVTHRRDPIYCSTIVGRPPTEDFYMGEAVEQLFLPVIRRQLPEVVDLHLPAAGVFHNLLLVSINKAYPGHAHKVMHALWGLGQLMFSRLIVVVDADVNIRDYTEVTWVATNHIDAKRDLEIVQGPVDALDHASPLPDFGSKVGVDATRKWKSEGFGRDWPDKIVMKPEIIAKIDRLWPELGL
ncbi:MAG: menaquinone biosynthesis decarboxylase [Candidatus Sumerlaeota bacterium]|nr:menaquinone biosynthesis decarboxylase [Candidatus Sumerlaeota bacterium]